MLRYRTAADGSIWIPRPDEATEAFLDKTHLRWLGELRWSPKPDDCENLGEVDELNSRFMDQSAVLFGKGPSIQNFLAHHFHFAQGPVRVCLNETTRLVPNPQFGFFVDPHNAEQIQFPVGCTIVCPPSMVNRVKHPNGNRILTFTRGTWIQPAYATAACALATLCRWGVRFVLMVGFDSFDLTEAEQKKAKAYPPIVEGIQTKPRPTSYYGPINDQLRRVIDQVGKKGTQVAFYHRRSLTP